MSQIPEKQLPYLGFQMVLPDRVLAPYVRSYWYFRREKPLLTYHEEYMHPRGGFGVAFNFGDQQRLDGQPLTEPIFLDGSNTISRKMGFNGKIDMLGIRFWEGGAYPFIGIPLTELRDETALLDALDRRELMRLHNRLYEAEPLAARIQMVEQWLISRLSLGKERSLMIPASLANLRNTEGLMPISELAQKFAISQRQLERLYKAQVGMTPKQYGQLVRVENARLMLKQMSKQTNTRTAVDLGFYDQSHFIREFSAVVGMTPYQYMRRSQIRE